MRASHLSVFALLGIPVAAQQNDPGGTVDALPTCLPAVQDQATGNCVGVSTVPTIGMLYPLGSDFYFDALGTLQLTGSIASQGDVACQALEAGGIVSAAGIGVGTTAPAADLHIRRSSVQVLLESDSGISSSTARILFSKFAGIHQTFVGYENFTADFSIRNLGVEGGTNFDQHTSSTASWQFRRRASTATDVEARFTYNGSLQLDGSVSSPAADLAEYYPVAGDVEPGDVVAFTGEGLALERARAGADARLAGVVSSRPAFTMGLSYTVEDEPGVEPDPDVLAQAAHEPLADAAILHEIAVNRRAPLALSGRIPCKVTSQNGAIRAGDLLTASWIPGHAMKATAAGPVIGTALEDWDAGEGTILMLANLGWFTPTADFERRLSALEDEVRALRAAR